MKKISVLFLIFSVLYFSAFFCPDTKALSEEVQYLRVLNQTTYLYNSADTTSPCFLLPETYYVKVIRDEGDFYFVQYQENKIENNKYYQSIFGYCQKEDMFVCDYIPDNPYLDYQLDINDGAKGYISKDLISSTTYTFNENNPISYYGKYKINSTLYYYVYAFNSYRYYVKASDCQPINYSLNSDPLPNTQGEDVIPDEPEITQPKTDVSDKLKIALILILVIPALIATAFLFKPQKKQIKQSHPEYFYDDNDYE